MTGGSTTGGTSKSSPQAASGGGGQAEHEMLPCFVQNEVTFGVRLIKLHYFMQCRWIISILAGPPVENL